MSRPNYIVMVEYEGFTGDMDHKIRRIAKRHDDSSGYDLRVGVRDLSFHRKKKAGALRLFSRSEATCLYWRSCDREGIVVRIKIE